MKDVSLDDLIKKDKENGKKQNNRKPNRSNDRSNKKIIKGRRLIRKPGQNGQNKAIRNNGNNQHKKGIQNNKPRKFDSRPPKNNQRRPNQKKQRKFIEKKVTKEEQPKQEKGRTLKVLGLHPDITNNDLYKLFSAEGALEKCMIEQDNFGRNLPSAIVKYHSSQHAKSAQQKLNSHKVMNSVLTVQPYKNSRK